MKKLALPFALAVFCACSYGCTSPSAVANNDADPLPLVPDNARIDILKYRDLPAHELKGIANLNTVLSLFYQAGAAASNGECTDAQALIRTARNTPFWFDLNNQDLAPIVWRKLFIANMVGKNAVRTCDGKTGTSHASLVP